MAPSLGEALSLAIIESRMFGGGNALSGVWCLLPAQKAPPAGSVPTRLASLNHGRLDDKPLHKEVIGELFLGN